jgi:hypothetical protein
MPIKNEDEIGLYRDLLLEPYYIYRDNDPKEYGFICPHCFERYGEARAYVEVERCSKCPPYFPGMEIQWNINRATKKKLQALGYFSGKPKGGKRKSAAIQT